SGYWSLVHRSPHAAWRGRTMSLLAFFPYAVAFVGVQTRLPSPLLPPGPRLHPPARPPPPPAPVEPPAVEPRPPVGPGLHRHRDDAKSSPQSGARDRLVSIAPVEGAPAGE